MKASPIFVCAVVLTGLFLNARFASAQPIDVPQGAVWRYLDNGSDQGTAWRQQSFDDSGWASGPARLGFGGDGEQTMLQNGHITYYFRHAFTLLNPPSSGIVVRLTRDDGAVVYLNGYEVFRSNMPTGRVDHLTLASSAATGTDETNVFLSAVLTSSVLQEGANVVAVEVHQNTANSADLGFDLELVGNVPEPASLTLQVPAGWSTIANNFNRGGNTLNEVIPVAADGTEIHKWNPATQTYLVSVYDALDGSWSANRTLGPGEGAWIHSPTSQTITLTGQFSDPIIPTSRPLAPVLRMVGGRWPVASTFEEVMGFAPIEGDRMLFYEGSFAAIPAQVTREFTVSNGVWHPTLPPLLEPGKAVFVDLAAVAPPTIVQQPQNVTVDEGGQAFFFVGASGATPINYQWRKDGVLIAGATVSFFDVTNAALSDAGAYSVVVSNPGGSVTSTNVILTINSLSCLFIHCPSNIVANCAGLGGTVVTYSVSAGNPCNPNDFVLTCVPSSGSVFPVGTTTVNCTNGAPQVGKEARCSFTITVLSNCPPCLTVTCPSDMVVPCQGTDGAFVSYGYSASNRCNPNQLAVFCNPPSPSFFPVGTTPVTCTAIGNGETNRCNFNVTVLSNCPPTNCLANLVVNGSFESPGLPDEYRYLPGESTFITGWKTLLNGVEYADLRSTRPEVMQAGVAADGVFTIDLATLSFAGGGIEQKFPTRPNQSYHVSFKMGTYQLHGRDGTASLTVATDWGYSETFSTANYGSTIEWSLKRFTFTTPAAGTETTLRFTSNNDGDTNFVVLDDVRVTDCCLELICPPRVTAECQTPNGAPVAWTVVAANHCAPNDLTVVCTPSAGSWFPPGTTYVTCTASGSGVTQTCTFPVIVAGLCGGLCEENRLVNGSFEQPGRADGYLAIPAGSDPALLPAWTVLPAGVEYADGTSLHGAIRESGAAPDGGFYIDLAYVFSINGGGVEQFVTTTPGERYTLSFFAGTLERDDRDGTGHLEVSVVPSDLPTSPAYNLVNHNNHTRWDRYEFSCIAASTSTLIKFTTTDNAVLHNVLIDDVRLTRCPLPCLEFACPTNIVVNCQGTNGTPVYYTVVATNHCGAHEVGVACVPPSGSLFPPGTTTVNCTASSSNETRQCSFTVTVTGSCGQDCLELRCPDPILRPSTDPTGTVVFFSLFATNRCQPQDLSIGCTPPSGHHFDIGTTIVHCWATGGGRTIHCDFPVVVTDSKPCVPPPPSAWNVLGKVSDGAGRPLQSVRVSLASLDGPASFSTVTDASGNYALTGAAGEKYRVSAAGAGHVALPASLDVGPLDRDVVVDFTVLSPFENWQRTHWGASPPPEAAPGADPDGDRRVNLMEYATGTDPRVLDAARGLHVAFSGGASPHVTVELELSPDATDIVAGLQAKPLPSLVIGPWLDALRYYPAGRDGTSVPEQRWTLPLVTPTAVHALPAPRVGVTVDLPPLAEALVFRMSVCFLSECGEPATAPAASLPPTGDSLRIGFMNVQFMDEVAMFLGSVLGEFNECCGGCDRGGEIARRIIAGDYDVVALAEVWVDGGGFLSRVMEALTGGTVEEKAREWARMHIPAGTTEEEIRKREEDIVKLIERWMCALGPFSGNSKARLIELLGRAGYIHRVEKLDDFGNLQDSGLMLFSRFPFERLPTETRAASERYIDLAPFGIAVRAVNGSSDWNSEVAFVEFPLAHCNGYECQSAKGAGLVRIKNPYSDRVFNVAFTHTESGGDPDDGSARFGQLGDIKQMIETVLGDRMNSESVFVVGDINIKGSLTPDNPDRMEWQRYFDPAGGREWVGFFTNTLADVWERQVATVGDSHSPRLPDIEPVPPTYRDPGLTGGADRGGTQRYDFLLANDPSLISINSTQRVSVQHLAVAHDLMGDPTTNRTAFGFEGARILSDHFGLVADINIRESQCSPPLALVEKDLKHEDDRGHAYPGILRHPGSMQWWRFDAPGTYSFGLAPSGRVTTNDLEYMVFSSRDLSRPLRPVRPQPRILQSDADCRQVVAYTFHSDDAPIYVRVRHVRRSETASFDLVARRHQCVSQEDSCELHPNIPPTEVKPLPPPASRERWFRLQTECPTSRRPQVISFETRPAVGFRGLHHFVFLQADRDGSLGDIAEAVPGDDPIRLVNSEFREGGVVVYARVAPFPDTLRDPFFVLWTNNLTVFDPERIRNDEALDEDVLWDNQDDEFERITLTLSTPDATPPWSHIVALGGRFLDFNYSQSRYVNLELFPTVRFLPDEVFIIKFDEDDVTQIDEMTARVFPLGAEEPGAESDRVPIQEVSGDGGRYQIFGHKRHFGSRRPFLAPTSCPDP